MPAKGRIETRAYDDDEQAALAAEAADRQTSVDALSGLLGATTCDVFLNDRAYWLNVPINAWESHHRRLPGDEEVAQLPRA